MNNPLLKYVMKDQIADVIHSSAYASAQTGANFGATSSEAFAARQNIEENRRYVQGYRNAKIIGNALPAHGSAKVYTPTKPAINVRPLPPRH
jgi:hypothetical protein